MAISRSHGKKSPNQNPVAFFECKQAGGPEGKGGKTVPDKLTSGPQREKVYGKNGAGK